MEIKSFRELPVEYLAKIGLELFSENQETGTANRTLHAKHLYEELYERTIKDIPFTDAKGNVLVGFYGYEVKLIQLRKELGINKNDFENSKYPLSKSQKDKLISVIKGSYDFDAVKQRLIMPNTDEIKTKNVETQLLFIFENLHFLQNSLRGHLGLTNITHFMSRAEIAFEIILCLCDTDRTKIENITKEILFETEQKTYNPYFTHTLRLVNKYYQERFSGSAISEIVDGLNCGGNRHRTEGALYTKKLEFLPQYLSREVYILLNEYLNPSSNPESMNKEKNNTNNEKSIKKVLFLTANPKETSRLRLDKEIREVGNGFESATERDKFEFFNKQAVTISDITNAIQKIKPHIVHFSGHGEGKEGLVVEGKNGEMECFNTQSLGRLFNLFKEEVECVVLNACYSQEQALAISSKGIYAIGTNDSIEDQAAIDFSKGFYQSIGEGNDYEFAFQIGLVHVNDIEAVNKSEIWFNGVNITENNNSNQSTSHNEIRKTTKKENKYKSETTDINSPIEKEVSPKNIFICYAGEDSLYKEKFERSLANLKRENKIKIWSDQEILAGEKPDETIEMHLKEADIIVLLLSPDFLDSDKIWDKEFPAIEKHLKNKTAKVIPILLRACDWIGTKIGELQTIPTNPINHELEPISKWEDKDEAWQIILNQIKKII